MIAGLEEYTTKSTKKTKKGIRRFDITVNWTQWVFILELYPVVLKGWTGIDTFKNSDWELSVRAKKTPGQIQVSNLGTGSKRSETLVIESK